MTHADFNDLETRDYVFKIGDRGKGIQARYDENTDALIFPRAVFDYVCKLLNEALSQEPCDTIARFPEDRLEYALQTFTHKPCDDAISREDAIRKLRADTLFVCTGDKMQAISDIEGLPSVTQKSEHFIDGVHAMGYREGYKDAQKQKSGKWIDYSDEGYVECPFCEHATTCEDNIDELHYCFYCGARMESEDKE